MTGKDLGVGSAVSFRTLIVCFYTGVSTLLPGHRCDNHRSSCWVWPRPPISPLRVCSLCFYVSHANHDPAPLDRDEASLPLPLASGLDTFSLKTQCLPSPAPSWALSPGTPSLSLLVRPSQSAPCPTAQAEAQHPHLPISFHPPALPRAASVIAESFRLGSETSYDKIGILGGNWAPLRSVS